MPGGGYNPVLVKFGDLLQQLASQQNLQVADLNGPVVRMLERAKVTNAELAPRMANQAVPDLAHGWRRDVADETHRGG